LGADGNLIFLTTSPCLFAHITPRPDKGEYVNEITAEVDIVDGEVLIQFNNTNIRIKQLLLENGVDELDTVIPSLEKA
jgi:hypothetical protein